MKILLRSKIHKAIVTAADTAYIGSITIDEALMEKAGLWEGEQVHIADNTNGARLITYVIRGERNSGVICMNGAAAHLVRPGDEIIIMAFEVTDTPVKPVNILVDSSNRFVRYLSGEQG
ncbi:MAG: aspartate 1-decarboxylase [Fibrobacterota bacterium]